MAKKIEILCPYCCSRFYADQVHFRLKGAVEEVEVDIEEESDDDDDDFSIVGRSRKSKKVKNTKSDGKTVDQKLYDFYIDSGLDEDAAKADAMQFGFVEFDPENGEIEYDRAEENKHGYVNCINYKGQTLTQRLCPNCHKNLIVDAGKYPMYMFSVIGDTNVGKSIFLTVLEEMLEGDCFDTNMIFVGTPEEREYFKANNKTLIRDRELLKATIGRVPPLTFRMTFKTADMSEKEKENSPSVFVTFCDIPGEMCRSREDLAIYGKHLKASSGLLFLVDPTRFPRIRLAMGNRDEDDNKGNSEQLDVINAISLFLIEGTHETKSGIPTAIIITKSDILTDHPYFVNGEGKEIITDPDWEIRHNGFINDDEIKRINEGVVGFLKDIHEGRYITKMKDLFSDYSFFINSALGHKMDDDDDYEEQLRKDRIEPYRISESFYWVMAQNFVLPRKIRRIYKNTKTNEEKELVIYYRKKGFNVNQEFENLKERYDMKDGAFGGLFSGKWECKGEFHS
ncbi:MAG: hypothetical protein K6E85_02010 [Lachnospiraceae bacterium]|nr:hypothetical protein [Lachnospiraceae bacterium]